MPSFKLALLLRLLQRLPFSLVSPSTAATTAATAAARASAQLLSSSVASRGPLKCSHSLARLRSILSRRLSPEADGRRQPASLLPRLSLAHSCLRRRVSAKSDFHSSSLLQDAGVTGCVCKCSQADHHHRLSTQSGRFRAVTQSACYPASFLRLHLLRLEAATRERKTATRFATLLRPIHDTYTTDNRRKKG